MHPQGLYDESLVVGPGGGIANVVVSLQAQGTELKGPLPSGPAVLDQRGCQYQPHVLAVMVGQPIVVRNSDRFLHNVHALPVYNPAFNLGQPTVDPGRAVGPMMLAERFRVKCDVHPWMGAYINVFDHPYFAVTGADGTFAIPGTVPDGRYTLLAWHETLGEKTAMIEVARGVAGETYVRFDAPDAP
jgi:plastocyanin